MKIALFSDTYVPSPNGVATHVKTLKEGLENLGHEVLIVTTDSSIKKHTLEQGILRCPGKSIKKIYNHVVSTPISSKRYKYIKDFNPDVIHIHTEFGVGFFGVIISKMLKRPLVYTLHTMYDDYIHYIAPKSFTPIVRKTAHKYAKFLGKSANTVIGPSKKVPLFLKACGVKKDVIVVPNAVELDMFNIDSVDKDKVAQLKTKYNISDDQTILFVCSRIAKEKNIDIILEYWKEKVKPEDNFRFFIIGDGPHRKFLEQRVKELGIENDVLFLGNINRDDLPPYYAMCDLFITGSLTEANSISMLEAMAIGRPVIHNYDQLNKGQVKPGINGYIFKNASEMYDSMLDFKNKSLEDKQKFIMSVRNSVEEFGVNELAKKVVNIYSETIKKYKSPKSKRYKIKIHKKHTKK